MWWWCEAGEGIIFVVGGVDLNSGIRRDGVVLQSAVPRRHRLGAGEEGAEAGRYQRECECLGWS